jgi:hypothetical protein
LAVLLQTFGAGFAVLTGVDHAADGGLVSALKIGNTVTDLVHPADNLVTRHYGIDRALPLISDKVLVCMTHATILDVDRYVVWTNLAASDLKRT